MDETESTTVCSNVQNVPYVFKPLTCCGERMGFPPGVPRDFSSFPSMDFRSLVRLYAGRYAQVESLGWCEGKREKNVHASHMICWLKFNMWKEHMDLMPKPLCPA